MTNNKHLFDNDMYLNDSGELVVIHQEASEFYWQTAESPRCWDNYTHWFMWDTELDSPDTERMWHGNQWRNEAPTIQDVLEEFITYDEVMSLWDEWDEAGQPDDEGAWMFRLYDYGEAINTDYLPGLIRYLNEHGAYARGVSWGGSEMHGTVRFYFDDDDPTGIIYMTEGDRRKCGTPTERINDLFEGDMDVYANYLNGEVYWFETFNIFGEQVDSCSGFYGDDIDGIAWHCGGLNDCDYRSLDEYLEAHEEEAEELVRETAHEILAGMTAAYEEYAA